MFSPEENQISICLLKSNLEEIESDLVEQRSAWPELDAENEQKCRDTLNAVRVVRALSVETERLNQENVRLVAKRMQLKRQSDDISKAMQKARNQRLEMQNALKHEEQETELHIRKYEDSLREKALRFRESRGYYDEVEMRVEIEKVENIIIELESELSERQTIVSELRHRLDKLQPAVPEDLLAIVGKMELNETVKLLTNKCEALKRKRDDLRNRKI